MTWEQLAAMEPDQIRDRDAVPGRLHAAAARRTIPKAG